MTERLTPGSKPRIIVSAIDHQRLIDLAVGAASRFPEVSEELQSEMDRAEVVETVPDSVAQMGSTVEFHSDAGQHRRVTLVFPAEADISANRVSILTPIGTALIGLSAGQSINWTTRDGRQNELTVISVAPPQKSPGASGGENSGTPDAAR